MHNNSPLKKASSRHALIFALLCTAFLFFLHLLPVNQLFIDPFAEAIKNHDITDVAFSKFRNNADPSLFDERIMILNSERTDRSEVATAIDFLTRHDAAGVGVDLIFDDRGSVKVDSALSAAIMRDNVVLGYAFEEKKKGAGSILGQESHPYFSKSASKVGYVNLATNDGFSVRAFEPYHVIEGVSQPSFAVQLAKLLDTSVVTDLEKRKHEIEWINFRRLQPGKINMRHPINKYEATHYAMETLEQFLKDTAQYKKSSLENRLFLIGFNGEDETALSMHDRYYTPLNEVYHGRSLPDMHGVVVHANIISMLLDKDYINEVPEKLLYVGGFFFFFINYFIFVALENKKLFATVPVVRVIQLVQFVLLFSGCILMITHFNIKIGFILMITAVILSYELFEFYEHKLEHRIQSLFASKKSKPTNHEH